jgi:serine/threonine protein kinase
VFAKPTAIPANPTKSIYDTLFKKKSAGDDIDLLKRFADFLEKCLICDPKKRMTPEKALAHPFIRNEN